MSYSHSHESTVVFTSTPDEEVYNKEANPYPRDCKQCKPLLLQEVRPDFSLRYKTREQMIEKVEGMRTKIRLQGIRLRHLDHELYDLQAAKDKLAAEAEQVADQRNSYGDRLGKFGLHPNQKAKTVSVNDGALKAVHVDKFTITKEDIDALRDIDLNLHIRKYCAKLSANLPTSKTYFQPIHAIDLSADDLSSYYDLAHTVLRTANTLRQDVNVVLAVEMLPKMSESACYRVLHPGEFAAWIEGMKMLRGGDYEILAYLYDTKEAEEAVMSLELDSEILKY